MWSAMGSNSQENLSFEQLVEQGVPVAEANRITVRASLRVALRHSFERCGGAWLCAMILLSLGFMVVLMWVMWVFSQHEGEQCDEPVASTLNVLIILLFLNFFQSECVRCCLCYNGSEGWEPCRVVAFRRGLFALLLIWPIATLVMLWQVESCPAEIVQSLYVIVIYIIVFTAIAVFIPALFITVMLCLIRRGMVSLPQRRWRGSVDSLDATVDILELLPTLKYDAKLREEIGNNMCPICIDEFSDGQEVIKTNCRPNAHIFHKDCLRGWTFAARTCPLCRSDLMTGARPIDVDTTDVELLRSESSR